MGRAIVSALAFLGFAVGATTARADCVSECDAATYCDEDMHASGECARKLNDCYISECSKPKVSYGSIAYDADSGAVGWSYDFGDAPAAEQKALANCGEHGSGCKVVIDFWNTCAAVAAGANGGVASGLGDTQKSAESTAIAGCEKDGGESCAIQAWSCTGQ